MKNSSMKVSNAHVAAARAIFLEDILRMLHDMDRMTIKATAHGISWNKPSAQIKKIIYESLYDKIVAECLEFK